MKSAAATVALVCLALGPAPALAQDRQPTKVAFASGVATAGGHGALALAASFEHGLARHLGLELELAFVPGYQSTEIRSTVPPLGFGSLIVPLPEFRSTTDVLVFVTNVVADVPLRARRLRQYIVAGGGVAHLDRLVDIRYPDVRPVGIRGLDASGRPTISLLELPPRQPVRSRVGETALALGTGAGLDVRLPWRLQISGEVRYARLFARQRLNLVRVSARIGCRF
ncbi:MAG TPA: hypothetical protein VNK92_06525 [Vicinamibacterales bacterium]|nr:hypothetical protein [Vicinamibacterales bacterium]